MGAGPQAPGQGGGSRSDSAAGAEHPEAWTGGKAGTAILLSPAGLAPPPLTLERGHHGVIDGLQLEWKVQIPADSLGGRRKDISHICSKIKQLNTYNLLVYK